MAEKSNESGTEHCAQRQLITTSNVKHKDKVKRINKI